MPPKIKKSFIPVSNQKKSKQKKSNLAVPVLPMILTIDNLYNYLIKPYKSKYNQYDTSKCKILNTDYKTCCINAEKNAGNRHKMSNYCTTGSGSNDVTFKNNLKCCVDKRKDFSRNCTNYLLDKEWKKELLTPIRNRYDKMINIVNSVYSNNYNIDDPDITTYFDTIGLVGLSEQDKNIHINELKKSKTIEDIYKLININNDFNKNFHEIIINIFSSILNSTYSHKYEEDLIGNILENCNDIECKKRDIYNNVNWKNTQDIEKDFEDLVNDIGVNGSLDFSKLSYNNIKNYIDPNFFINIESPQKILNFIKDYNNQKGVLSPKLFYDNYIKNIYIEGLKKGIYYKENEVISLLNNINIRNKRDLDVFLESKAKEQKMKKLSDNIKITLKNIIKLEKLFYNNNEDMSTMQYINDKIFFLSKEILDPENINYLKRNTYKTKREFDIEVLKLFALQNLLLFKDIIPENTYENYRKNIISNENKGDLKDFFIDIQDDFLN